MAEFDRCLALLLDFRLEQWQQQGVPPEHWNADIDKIQARLVNGELSEETKLAVITAVSMDKRHQCATK